MSDKTSAAEITTALVPMRAVRPKDYRSNPRKGCKGRLANGVAAERINAIGLDAILQRVMIGETVSDIAAEIRVSVSALLMYLNADESQESYARARLMSADSWLDKGMRFLIESGDSAAGVNRARALEMHCRAQAAIRNPRYSERSQVELSGPDGGPIRSQVQIAVYLPDNGR